MNYIIVFQAHCLRTLESETDMHLTPKELAERESVPISTVYKWNSEGTGPPAMKIGRHLRYRVSDVEAWEQSRITVSAA